MTYSSLMLEALEDEFGTDKRGQLVKYNGEDLVVIFRTGSPLVASSSSSGRSTRDSARVGELHVMVKNLPLWSYGDKVEIDGTTWKVIRDTKGSSWFKHSLHVECDRRLNP